MKKYITLIGLLFFVISCDYSYTDSDPHMRVARLEHEIATDVPQSLRKDLFFYQESKTLDECRKDYQECLLNAKMATASIRDAISRSIEQHSLTVDGMKLKGYQSIRTADLPNDCQKDYIAGVGLAGR